MLYNMAMADTQFLQNKVRDSQQGKPNPLQYLDTVGERVFHFEACPNDDGTHVYRTTMVVREQLVVYPSPEAFLTYRASMLSGIVGELNRADNKD